MHRHVNLEIGHIAANQNKTAFHSNQNTSLVEGIAKGNIIQKREKAVCVCVNLCLSVHLALN